MSQWACVQGRGTRRDADGPFAAEVEVVDVFAVEVSDEVGTLGTSVGVLTSNTDFNDHNRSTSRHSLPSEHRTPTVFSRELVVDLRLHEADRYIMLSDLGPRRGHRQ